MLGMPRPQLLERARGAECLINVMGVCQDAALLDAVTRRVFLDIDPGFPQMWRALGQRDVLAGHDRFATLARRIGQPDCTIPTCGLDWITLPQPVVLDHWPVAPAAVAADPEAYRRYLTSAKAELLVPKQMYVATRGGLLSDRSIYFLASGRPVLARDTGLAGLVPLGEGLVTFTTLREAAAGVAAIAADYPRHCRAAREIAEAEFDSDRVLERFLAAVMA